MANFYVPPEGIYFRLIGYVSARALYSRKSQEPTFGSILATEGPYPDNYFSLVKGTGANDGLFLIKNRVSGNVLYSRRSAAPWVGHIHLNDDGGHPDTWFKLVPGEAQFASMARLWTPDPDMVIVSRANTDNITNYPFTKSEPEPIQFFTFEYEDMLVDRVEYDLKAGKIMTSTPRVLATQTLPNDTSIQQDMSFSMEESVTETSSFDYTTGLTLSVGVTIKAGIPEIAEVEFRVDESFNKSWTYGKTESIQKTYKANFPVKAAARTKVHAVSTVNVGNLEVPYTLYLSSKSTGAKAQTHGIWRGVSSWDLRHSLSEVPM
ncbi:hemolytic lectin [Mycena latifolia]|nr:hemolytic lectin [Mycena latifolia]